MGHDKWLYAQTTGPIALLGHACGSVPSMFHRQVFS